MKIIIFPCTLLTDSKISNSPGTIYSYYSVVRTNSLTFVF